MRIVHGVAELREHICAMRAAGESIALVPTMGNLHRGHLSLVAAARAQARRVVVSIFVNPLQFGPGEDFERYPRTFEADATLLENAAADLLFAPAVGEMYPNGFPPATTVRVSGELTDQLDGTSRPGHFQGVATIVNMLFNRVQPDVAIFGQKDYQQLAVIRRMTSDLGLPIRVQGAPTERDADGLALSSRNQYLSGDERAIAPRLYGALQQVAAAIRAGRQDFTSLCAEQRGELENLGFRPDYLQVCAPDLSPALVDSNAYVILAAAWLGRTRLIDNLQFDLIAA